MSARFLLLVVSIVLLYVIGARGLLLLALAFLVSGVASFVLLSKQRDVMSGALMARIKNGQRRASGFRARLEEGARAEDEDLSALVDPVRAARQPPAGADEVARIPIGVTLQVVLVLGLGHPERPGRGHLGDYLARP